MVPLKPLYNIYRHPIAFRKYVYAMNKHLFRDIVASR